MINAELNGSEQVFDANFKEGGKTFSAEFGTLHVVNTGVVQEVKLARIVDVALYANAWVGNTSPYSQVVTVEGATDKSQVDLTPSAEQLAIFHDKDLAFVTENEDGIVTVFAIGQKPENDYIMQATVTEVDV